MVLIGLFDVAILGNEVFDQLRPSSFPQTDAFLLCSALDVMSSFENVKEWWCPDGVLILLVGTKEDLLG